MRSHIKTLLKDRSIDVSNTTRTWKEFLAVLDEVSPQTMSHASLTILDYAINYAREHGWAVFPCHGVGHDGKCTCGMDSCKSPAKHPVTIRGSHDASRDEVAIADWFDKGVWNIGVATGPISNLVVVDVDQGKGAELDDLLVGGLDETIFDTARVKTGAGLHFYYKLPAGLIVKNSAGRLGKFIDVRGEGGYVIAPPSRHISGSDYAWLGSTDSPLLEFPQQWIDKLEQPASTYQADAAFGTAANGFMVPPPSSGIILPDTIDQGKRNMELTKVAGALRSKGLSEGAIYAALNVENMRICKPPLDDKEIHQIARSVGRYTPHDVLAQVSDDDAAGGPDHENTIAPHLYGDFRNLTFAPKEILAFHIGIRDIALIQAATNAGKTTLLRNVTLCMAAGRPFMPFYEGDRPIKVAYFDFENDAQDVQRDLRLMDEVFTPDEMLSLSENLIVIPKGLMDGELFQFNRHEAWANSLILQNNIEFIIVDNVSAAYDINDENSNAEVTKKIIKPLLKMAQKGLCAFLFAHHYGKGKSELETAGVHAGRGASALGSLSKTVINMFGDVSKGDPVNIECAKRKTDGGQNYSETFRLEQDRWFHHTTIVAPPKKETAYKSIRRFMEGIVFPNVISTGEIILNFEDSYSEIAIKKAISELHKDGFLDKPGHGVYSGKPQAQKAAASANGNGAAAPVKSFYEKDED